MHLLEMVIAVQEGQAPDERHHHQLHHAPGRRVGVVAGVGLLNGSHVLQGPGHVGVLPPHCEDAHQKGEGGHDHLPWLGGAELPVGPEHLSHGGGEHH